MNPIEKQRFRWALQIVQRREAVIDRRQQCREARRIAQDAGRLSAAKEQYRHFGGFNTQELVCKAREFETFRQVKQTLFNFDPRYRISLSEAADIVGLEAKICVALETIVAVYAQVRFEENYKPPRTKREIRKLLRAMNVHFQAQHGFSIDIDAALFFKPFPHLLSNTPLMRTARYFAFTRFERALNEGIENRHEIQQQILELMMIEFCQEHTAELRRLLAQYDDVTPDFLATVRQRVRNFDQMPSKTRERIIRSQLDFALGIEIADIFRADFDQVVQVRIVPTYDFRKRAQTPPQEGAEFLFEDYFLTLLERPDERLFLADILRRFLGDPSNAEENESQGGGHDHNSASEMDM